MSATETKPCCVSCGKEVSIVKCNSCWQIDDNDQSVLQEASSAQLNAVRQQHVLIQQVNDWECNSMKQIRKMAEEARQLIIENTTGRVSQVKTRLAQLTEQLGRSLQGNNFVAQNVSKWQEELVQLTKQLTIPSIITVRQVSSPLITKISVDFLGKQYIPNIPDNAKWAQNGTTVAGGNGQGSGLNQLYNPIDLYVDDDQTIYVADYNNHRVVEWKNGATRGRVVAGGNGPGTQKNQLNNPSMVVIDKEHDCLFICEYGGKRVMRWPCTNGTTGEIISSGVTSFGLAMHINGYLYASDWNKHEVKRWKIGETNSTVVAGGNGPGNRLDQLNCPAGICFDEDRSLYIADTNNDRVVKWTEGAREGIVVAGGHGTGNGFKQLSNPRAVVVDHLGTIYVADENNHRVMRWTKGATEGSVIVGGNGSGAQPNRFNHCMPLAFDREGNLFVVDHNNHRVQKFNIESYSIQ